MLIHPAAPYNICMTLLIASKAVQALVTTQESTWNITHQNQKANSVNSTFAVVYVIWGIDLLVLNRSVAELCH